MAVQRLETVNIEGLGRVSVFQLTNGKGIRAKLLNYGGIIASLFVPDREGKIKDVVLGCDTVEDYLRQRKYFGAILGRCANRIENGTFVLNGREYSLAQNDGQNHLHGGSVGFDQRLWAWEIKAGDTGQYLELTYRSRGGQEGYPGNLDVRVSYSLSETNGLVIDYFAEADQDTLVNLSNHSYFNLLGHDGGDIKGHKLRIFAEHYGAVDENCLANGELIDVAGTPFDFTKLTPIGPGLQSGDKQIINGKGYDHNWVLTPSQGGLRMAAKLYEPQSGRLMEVYTTKPGVQFYSGNFLDGAERGKGGIRYKAREGLCLETQYFPNGLRHGQEPSPILRAGEKYRHTTVYKFSVK